MTDTISLAALASSRVCHDLISPISALVTGLEVLEDESDQGMREHALQLIKSSAEQAATKLEFARLAFGASGGAGAALNLGEARALATRYFAFAKADLDWRLEDREAPKAQVKAIANLCIVAAETIPRGGVVRVEQEGDAVVLTAEGPRARLIEATEKALTGECDGLDPKSVQPYLAGRLAESANCVITHNAGEERIQFRLAPRV